jgi:predicted transcriptional regulator
VKEADTCGAPRRTRIDDSDDGPLIAICGTIGVVEKTTLYLPTQLLRTYRQLAQRTGRSQAALMREALQRFADRQERPRLKSLGLAKNVRLQGADVEAWLEANWRPEAEWREEPRSGPV